MGYHRAGFDEIVGIDIEPQPDYPFEFVQADVFDPARDWWALGPFDLVHASPPCQGYTPMTNRWGSEAPQLINQTRAFIRGASYVIENVAGAGLDGVQLCGSSFDLPTRRHRYFEASFLIWAVPCRHNGPGIAVYGKPDGRRLYTRADGTELRAWASVEEGQQALGIDWTDDWHQLREAIPPAYTQYIGEQFLDAINPRSRG